MTACLHHDLAPGETECTTVGGGAVVSTHCETGQPRPTPAPVPYYYPIYSQTPQTQTPVPTVERRIVTGTRPLHCALDSEDSTIGACFLTAERCEQYVADARRQQTKTPYADCEQRNAGACFNYNEVVTGLRSSACAPTVTSCEYQLATFRKNPDYEVTAKQCGIYRYEPDGASGDGEQP